MIARAARTASLTAVAVTLAGSCANEISTAPQHADVAVSRAPLVTSGCSASQTAELESAVNDAYALLFRARLAISSIGAGGDSSAFDYWFGSHDDSERVTRISRNIENAIGALPRLSYECTNSCGNGEVAEATAGNPDRPIKLCADYWNPAQPYLEIKVGVLIHEYMHVVWLSDVQDPYCDPEQNHTDAASDPELASKNPEAYRLFILDWVPGEPFHRVGC